MSLPSVRSRHERNYIIEREGTLSGVSRGQILLKESDATTILSVAENQVTRFDVWGPGSETHAATGALIGAITGGVLFGVGGFYATRCPNHCSNEYANGLGALLAVPGSAVGLLVGALVGRSEKRPGWHPVALPLKVSLAPAAKRNFRLSGSLTF